MKLGKYLNMWVLRARVTNAKDTVSHGERKEKRTEPRKEPRGRKC